MRWIVRDLGIFLYGCTFAGKCTCAGILGRRTSQPKKYATRQTLSLPFVLSRAT